MKLEDLQFTEEKENRKHYVKVELASSDGELVFELPRKDVQQLLDALKRL